MRTLTLSSIVLAAMCCLGLQAQNTYFVEHFTEGIPSSFALYDMDGNEIEINNGKTFVCVIQNDKVDDVVVK